jgi:predicted CopG family antitoxin
MVDRAAAFVQLSCMGRTITIDDDAYKLLSSLKRSSRDSFTRVILRHVNRPADTCGELLEALDNSPPPNVDLAILDRIGKERGRRSGGRK